MVKSLCQVLILAIVCGTLCTLDLRESRADNSANFTTIHVTDMHCATCAKKIAAKLYGVPGVLEVRANVKADKAYVVPQKTKTPSPKAIWEAVEAAGFKPTKMSGPAGKFTKKPSR